MDETNKKITPDIAKLLGIDIDEPEEEENLDWSLLRGSRIKTDPTDPGELANLITNAHESIGHIQRDRRQERVEKIEREKALLNEWVKSETERTDHVELGSELLDESEELKPNEAEDKAEGKDKTEVYTVRKLITETSKTIGLVLAGVIVIAIILVVLIAL